MYRYEFVCNQCGGIAVFDSENKLSDAIVNALNGNYPCSECADRQMKQRNEELKQEAHQRFMSDMKAGESKRMIESNLTKYELGYDAGFPGANNRLADTIMRCRERSLWVIGASGQGKTRCVQNAARTVIKAATIRYWPIIDMMAHLADNAKKIQSALWDIYKCNLLIIDDLGKEALTNSRLSMLSAIIDRRYIGWDQVRRIQRPHDDHPTFHAMNEMREDMLGGQIWVTSQLEPEMLMNKLAATNQEDAVAIVRRLAEMCEIIHA